MSDPTATPDPTSPEAALQSEEQALVAAVNAVTALVQQLRTQVTTGGAPTTADVEEIHNAVIALNQLVPGASPQAPPATPAPAPPTTTPPDTGTTPPATPPSGTTPPAAP